SRRNRAILPAGESVSIAGGQVLRLRKEVAGVDRQLRSGFENSEPGFAEREILPIGRADQGVEAGVVEQLPPVDRLFAVAANVYVVGVDPIASNRRGGAA